MGNKINKAYIFAGPDLEDISFLKGIDFSDACLLAADCGIEILNRLNLSPNLIIGDFDSHKKPEGADCEILTFKIEKDDTDTMLCVKNALEAGFDDITIISGVGGRLDHTIANIQTLSYILNNGAVGRILSDKTEIYLLSGGSYSFDKRAGYSMSLFSYSERVSNLSISGAKYNARSVQIDNTFPLGVSNEIVKDSCSVSFDEGCLLVVFSRL